MSGTATRSFRAYVILAAFALCCSITTLFASSAAATNSFGPAVDDTLAAVATAPGTTASTKLHVIVYGRTWTQRTTTWGAPSRFASRSESSAASRAP